jgi:hypothetical protein
MTETGVAFERLPRPLQLDRSSGDGVFSLYPPPPRSLLFHWALDSSHAAGSDLSAAAACDRRCVAEGCGGASGAP